MSDDKRLPAWSLGGVLTNPATEPIAFPKGAGSDSRDFARAGATALQIAVAVPEGASELDSCLGVRLSRDCNPATTLVGRRGLTSIDHSRRH